MSAGANLSTYFYRRCKDMPALLMVVYGGSKRGQGHVHVHRHSFLFLSWEDNSVVTFSFIRNIRRRNIETDANT